MTTNVIGSLARERPGKALHVSLWIAQMILAAMFGMVGWLKASTPLDLLMKGMPLLADLPGWLIRFIGLSELAGALGMLLPALTRIQPKLTALAGVALAIVMALAVAFHLLRGEAFAIGVPSVLGALAAFVAWGRYTGAPIAPRD